MFLEKKLELKKIRLVGSNDKKKSSIKHNLFLILLLTLIFLMQACSSPTEKTRRPDPRTVNLGYVEQDKLISNGKDFGIEVLAVRLSAKNYILDFRFRLTDVEKAEHIMQRKIKAKMIVEKNQAVLLVPVSYKLGALRQSGKNLKINKNYFMFFANPGAHVKVGDLVTIQIAGFKAEHIIVN